MLDGEFSTVDEGFSTLEGEMIIGSLIYSSSIEGLPFYDSESWLSPLSKLYVLIVNVFGSILSLVIKLVFSLVLLSTEYSLLLLSSIFTLLFFRSSNLSSLVFHAL
uniref:hypothetical protein n=1 Tax=Amanita sinensis TaxID=67728 RepID=UPI001D1002F4|nr:hypothetical protein LK379_mgp16 [Amanita sinensis]QZN08173.1 hypothetical protein [Amanita sinensis]